MGEEEKLGRKPHDSGKRPLDISLFSYICLYFICERKFYARYRT